MSSDDKLALAALTAVATPDQDGLMSADDKTRLDALAALDLDWILSSSLFATPEISYLDAEIHFNTTGSIIPRVDAGTLPFDLWQVASGTLPAGFTLNSETGEITYTSGATAASGVFGITATSPAGTSAVAMVSWDIVPLPVLVEFYTGGVYNSMRLSTAHNDDEKIYTKAEYTGCTTSSRDGTLLDSNNPIYTSDNGNGTWNYFMCPHGYSYWILYTNVTTDPTTLYTGLVTDIVTNSSSALVSRVADDVVLNDAHYPVDQTDVHYLGNLTQLQLGSDDTINGFLADDKLWSYGFTAVDAIPRDGLSRVLFTRETSNFTAFYLGQNDRNRLITDDIYSKSVAGNGVKIGHSGDPIAIIPTEGIAAGSRIRVTYDGLTQKLFVDSNLYWEWEDIGQYWDPAAVVNSLSVTFGQSVRSNVFDENGKVNVATWQGRINRLWISNGVVEDSDISASSYPSSITHSWDMNETSGGTFSSSYGNIIISVEKS